MQALSKGYRALSECAPCCRRETAREPQTRALFPLRLVLPIKIVVFHSPRPRELEARIAAWHLLVSTSVTNTVAAEMLVQTGQDAVILQRDETEAVCGVCRASRGRPVFRSNKATMLELLSFTPKVFFTLSQLFVAILCLFVSLCLLVF
jgi:hypothetical protein